MELRDVVIVCVIGVKEGGAFAGTFVEDMLIWGVYFVSSNQNATSAGKLFRG